jgi:type I restriction enzyme S subunit
MNTPKLRFSQFTDSWNLDKLIAKVSLYSGLTYTPDDVRSDGTLVLRSSNVQNGEISLLDNVYVNPSVAKSQNVEVGDIIVVVRNGSRALIGKHAQIKSSMLNTVIGAFMTGIRSGYPNFMNALLSSGKFGQEVEKNLGATINQITNATFNSMEFFYPNDEEQIAIGDFFTSLDSMISLTSKKIEKLKQTLTGCMQTMFPQEGELEPKIRFKGFERKWKKVILRDCLEISNERNKGNIFGKDEVLSVSDDYGVMNQIKLLGRSYAGVSVENYKILRKDQIVYTKSPLKLKPYGIIKVNKSDAGIVSVLYAVYNVKEGVDPDFIHFYFEPPYRINNYLLPLISKGAKHTMNISDDNALNGYILIPSKDEQSKIVNYFNSLNEMISLQSKRLDMLKHIKSACLDNMFV